MGTRKFIHPNDTLFISIDSWMVVNCLCVPNKEEFFDLTFGGVTSKFSTKKDDLEEGDHENFILEAMQ